MSTIFGGISVETPKYTVLKPLGTGGAELRQYAPQIRAEVRFDAQPNSSIMDGLNSPFRTLAGFIFGGNTARASGASEKVEMTAPVVMQSAPAAAQKIAMTAPVVMQSGSAGGEGDAAAGGGSKQQRIMSFVMPSKYKSVEELPLPKDARVSLVTVPERTFAALQFRGLMRGGVAAQREAELRAAAEKEGVRLSADPHEVQYGSYNPPWCLPWLRTNDILIPVAAE